MRRLWCNIYLFLRWPFLFIWRRWNKRQIPSRIEEVLIIRPDRLGDMVMTLPLIRTIRDNLKNVRIYVLGSKNNKGLIEGDEDIRDVFDIGNPSDLNRVYNIRYDLAIDTVMDWRLRSAFFAKKSKAKFLIGFDIAGRGMLFDIKIKPAPGKTMSECILELIKPLGFRITYSIPRFFPTDSDRKGAERYLSKIELKKKMAVIHPGGYYPSQRWMPERFAEVADEVVRHTGANVVIIGSRTESKIIYSVKTYMREGSSVIIDCPLRILAALLSRACLFIGNNSGPLHIAAAVGIPTISFMGPTEASLWSPQGDNHIILETDLPCRPCQKAYCRRHDCLREIKVEYVLEHVSRLWKDLYGDWI